MEESKFYFPKQKEIVQIIDDCVNVVDQRLKAIKLLQGQGPQYNMETGKDNLNSIPNLIERYRLESIEVKRLAEKNFAKVISDIPADKQEIAWKLYEHKLGKPEMQNQSMNRSEEKLQRNLKNIMVTPDFNNKVKGNDRDLDRN